MISRLKTAPGRLQELLKSLNVKSFPNLYEDHFQRASNDITMEDFWAEQAQSIDWFKAPEIILDKSRAPFYKWFKGGLMNTSYNCLDRHAKTQPNATALIYESAYTKAIQTFTYAQLTEDVSRLAGVLQKYGVKKGDTVIIYMPMIPESVVAFQAVNRIGAMHSVVFGGFGGNELGARIKDCKPKVIITASCGIEPHAIIDYKTNVDHAIEVSGRTDIKKIVVQREQKKWALKKGEDLDYYDELSKAKLVDPVPVDATDPLYVLYTSGTTGAPKGIVRENGGNAVALSYSMKYIMDVGKGETYFSTSDIGWVVGHSYIVYGPLLAGCSTILYEGKPVGTPDPGQVWRLCEKYKAKNLFTSPTAMRTLRKEDHEGHFIGKYDLSHLKMILLVGERTDIPGYNWLRTHVRKDMLINDNYWQTETGWPISTNYLHLNRFDEIAGSCGKPTPGNRVTILGEDGKSLPPRTLGRVYIKLPMPPSFMSTLYGNDEAFKKKYLDEIPGYYSTGDAGYLDEKGFLHVTTRVDDIINTAGHRLSTSQMEEVLTHHKDIVEAAVVPGKDEIKGEVPIGFVVLKDGSKRDPAELEKECIKKVREDIGAVASFKKCMIVDKLPKTRSGKIVRNVLKALVNGEEPKIPPTIEDIKVVEDVRAVIQKAGLGKRVDIEFEEDVKK